MSILRIAKARSKNLRAECHRPDSSTVYYRTVAIRWQRRPWIWQSAGVIAMNPGPVPNPFPYEGPDTDPDTDPEKDPETDTDLCPDP
jgi:hypothetical protein